LNPEPEVVHKEAASLAASENKKQEQKQHGYNGTRCLKNKD